jgi:hypothetical protein
MGFDVTYHPINEDEIQKWYFDVLKNSKLINILAKEYNIDEFYVKKYSDAIMAGKRVKNNDLFDKTHGLYIATVQGFFRQYFYTRGSSFSFLIDKNNSYKKYTKSWENIIKHKIKNRINNKITENYCSGVFIPYENILRLLNDYNNDIKIKNELEEHYSENRINVFVKAVKYSENNKLGLLEATEVVEPNPTDLNSSTGYTNFWNCDHDGPILYQEAVEEQLKNIKRQY